jgi:hypothetical protein
MAGLFGSSLLPEDKLLALKLLRNLTELQLVPSENPRRYVLYFKEINIQKLILHKGTLIFFQITIQYSIEVSY